MRLIVNLPDEHGEMFEREVEVPDDSAVAREIRAAAGPYSMLSIDGDDL